MLKKILVSFLVGVMAVSMVACSADTGITDTSFVDDLAEPDATDVIEDSQSLTVWAWDETFNLYALQAAEEVYRQTHPNFELNAINTPWQDLQTSLITAATSNQLDTLPDIFLVQNNAIQKNVGNFPQLFSDLTDTDIPFHEFGAGALSYSTVEERHYAVPFDNGTAVLALRTDVLAESGYTIKDFTNITWNQFIEQGAVVLQKTGTPLLSGQVSSGEFLIMLMKTAGRSLFDEEGNPDIAHNEVLEESMNTYKELVDAGVFVQTNSWEEYLDSFVSGSTAGAMNGCWILGNVQVADEQAGNWAITNIPRLDGIPESVHYTENGGSSWCVSAVTPNHDLAVDFLNSTFAGSTEFYDSILSPTGALSNWRPAGDSAVYAKPQEFFGGQAIYADIVDYAGNVKPFGTGIYYYEAANAIAVQAVNIINGDIGVAGGLQAAQDEVEFTMQ